MANFERRQAMALDEAFDYYRKLENRQETPHLWTMLSALATIDSALSSSETSITQNAWSCVRDGLFNILISSFPGSFRIYGTSGPVEPSQPWPDEGIIEFCPQDAHRREDAYRADLSRLEPDTACVLRWNFADEKPQIRPQDFASRELDNLSELLPADEPTEQERLLASFYEICCSEAHKGKKKAHHKWWQLYWEANSCTDKRQRNSIRKNMLSLQSVWGKPS